MNFSWNQFSNLRLILTLIRQTFSPTLFSDYEGLKRYLSGEEDLKEVQAQVEQPTLESYSQPGLGRVIFKGLITSPLALLAPSESCVIYLLNKIGLRSIASFVEVASSHLCREEAEYFKQRNATSLTCFRSCCGLFSYLFY